VNEKDGDSIIIKDAIVIHRNGYSNISEIRDGNFRTLCVTSWLLFETLSLSCFFLYERRAQDRQVSWRLNKEET
jgi:hypothetical protein